ncbi:putative nicotinate phosphoribosyltransferase [Schistosoma mansoni]|uniref:putative nicotinate phosphoribosyltransferase n=1 Tax=Schistosoma mansoni TaxID=6183 RepID=UPI00022DC261|nr:putative nicotinate phosphoribosyltransferase [Schistosoma mansoni]|eukprot:XP_018647862.1 putative nicotinate phosphoribosyltransferase [Schistosoma mansoni]
MSYAYWKAEKANDTATFEIFFRKNPFNGEFTIFAGLQDCIDYLSSFKFTQDDIDYLRKVMPSTVDPDFFDYLLSIDTKGLSLWSVKECSVVFPKVPIMRVEGPVVLCQLVESTLLNLVNYASLVTTNATRYRLACGPSKKLYEFGLRRAQGPDGALSASKYAYLGGYDGTSNVLSGKIYGIPVVGTHAHSFVSAFQSSHEEECINDFGKFKREAADLNNSYDDHLLDLNRQPLKLDEFLKRCWYWSSSLSRVLKYQSDQIHPGELNAFANYAVAFPTKFLGLLDTYDVLKSGLPNFCAVALALHEFGYQAIGIRIDSGDMAYLSLTIRNAFQLISLHYNLPWFAQLQILASNDLNEDTLHSFNQQDHSIDAFCVGTNLVTCQKQPALGCVYKLVEINGTPTMKLSADFEKLTLPGKKVVYRLYSEALLDLMKRSYEDAPKVNERILCRHPTQASKRVFVVPGRVKQLLKLYWNCGKLVKPLPTLDESREYAMKELNTLRSDYKRITKPTQYKVSVSDELYQFTQELWLSITPIGEIS